MIGEQFIDILKGRSKDRTCLPIPFQPIMIEAIRDNHKTQTRRAHGLESINKEPGKWEKVGIVPMHLLGDDRKRTLAAFRNIETGHEADVVCPYGFWGSYLWTREAWAWEGETKYTDLQPIGNFWYKADFLKEPQFGPSRWKPAIHMPRLATRNLLKIHSIDVERAQSITNEDAMAEGIFRPKLIGGRDLYWNYVAQVGSLYTPIDSFKSLWYSINGEQSWNDNPLALGN